MEITKDHWCPMTPLNFHGSAPDLQYILTGYTYMCKGKLCHYRKIFTYFYTKSTSLVPKEAYFWS
jgi:hypothetical protein